MISAFAAAASGWATWTLAEYLLHRFAMHQLRGRGIMSREHLEHHVKATWSFDRLIILVWVGVVLVGAVVWAPLGWLLGGTATGIALGAGWTVGYFVYEYQHARCHLRPPRTRYQRWIRLHHFHHHFGAPMANHGVSTALWDHVFGTRERPTQIRVPRRLALPWLLDADGELRPAFASDYVLVGRPGLTEDLAALDRRNAFASVAPVD
jgi:sterol desaturase/sphingolipid hydroxylase (fatty acid hydroxylase superfamily)